MDTENRLVAVRGGKGTGLGGIGEGIKPKKKIKRAFKIYFTLTNNS